MSFGRGFGVGVLIVLVASVCYAATWQIIYYKITPDFSAKYSAYIVDQARKSGASQAAIDAKVAEMKEFSKMYENPLMNAAVTMLEPLPVGIVIALVSAGVLRRKRRDGSTMLAGSASVASVV